jgi:hypothetical protein
MKSKKSILTITIFLLLVFVIAGCSLLPTPTKGAIKGRVLIPPGVSILSRDISGWVPVAGAEVTIVDANGVTHTAYTDENGYYSFENIAVNSNTVVTATVEVNGNTIVLKTVIPDAIAEGEEYDTGTMDPESTALALVVEHLLDAGMDPGDIDLDEIKDTDAFANLVEKVTTAIQEGKDVTEDPDVTEVVDETVEEIISSDDTPPSNGGGGNGGTGPVADPEAEALEEVIAGTTLTGDLTTGITATFPTTIPSFFDTAGYKINSEIVLSDAVDGTITITRNGTPLVIEDGLDADTYTYTQLVGIAAGSTEPSPADFTNAIYGSQVENYSINVTGNTEAINTTVIIRSIISKDDFATKEVLDELKDLTLQVSVDDQALLLLNRVNASQLRITEQNQAEETIGSLLIDYFDLEGPEPKVEVGETWEIITLFWFDNYHYQDKFTFESLKAVRTALSDVKTEYAKIIATFRGETGGYDSNVEAVEKFLEYPAKLAETSLSENRTVADEIEELKPFYDSGAITEENKISDSIADTVNNIKDINITTLGEFLNELQSKLAE